MIIYKYKKKPMIFLISLIYSIANMTTLPTLYEHYTSGGISSGLSAAQNHFTLNDRNITLYSGAMHYFRVPQQYWRDRLRKIRAAGLNAVETYVPWNLHEPYPGVFDFGHGNSDFRDFLDVKKFLQTAQEEDLLAIVRPGPYICSEWEFGGLPSWLLRGDVRVRTNDEKFVGRVASYFKALFTILAALQFTRGGPIIAFQIENEYGSVENNDFEYLLRLKDIFKENGLVELLFTSDMPSIGKTGMIPDVLYTANFQNNPTSELLILKQYQPYNASMVMEYWTGWFDHWTETHQTTTVTSLQQTVETILTFPASINFYMFHGGTNWGFMNGANIQGSATDNAGYQPDTSSYDYDAPLTEAGNYTEKYYVIKRLIEQYGTIKTKTPVKPIPPTLTAYSTVDIIGRLSLKNIVERSEHHILSRGVLSMEQLSINNAAGQSYGYIIYRKSNLSISSNSVLQIKGRICDTALVIINGQLKSKILRRTADLDEFGYWRKKDGKLNLGVEEYIDATLEIVVENWGRNNFGQLDQFVQRKGLWQGDVLLNDETLFDWEIVPLEFRRNWNNDLNDWKTPVFDIDGPALYRGVLNVETISDTYIDMRGWNKGIVIVNGFVLSRYLRLGPQQAVYLPAPLLKQGSNEIVIFEHFTADNSIKFATKQIFETLN